MKSPKDLTKSDLVMIGSIGKSHGLKGAFFLTLERRKGGVDFFQTQTDGPDWGGAKTSLDKGSGCLHLEQAGGRVDQSLGGQEKKVADRGDLVNFLKEINALTDVLLVFAI